MCQILTVLEFLLNEGRALFPDTPVLALDLPSTFQLPQTDRHIIRQSIAYDMIGTLEEALKRSSDPNELLRAVGESGQVD